MRSVDEAPAPAGVDAAATETPLVNGASHVSTDMQITDAPDAGASPLPSTSTLAPTTAPTTNGNTLPISNISSNNNSNAPSPRVGTPMRNNNNPDAEGRGSRAASAHPDPNAGFTMPSEAPIHGAPVRQYINQTITPTLLEGMKMVAKEKPKDPLRVLGEFLIQRSKELESAS
ncbi:Dpy-30 motif-domain-containing protein [Diplogelasinospora grovesii]|uniref:Dpy-30 motif-domain-containing protein n=1 Tax=Diplogelasinospora grovesii TaxID=303347 RepID=A0AAN6S3H4_9PEZI|nr:Dpy-30 motif-domain-containing protein [Diplogelasinospora grovesii]